MSPAARLTLGLSAWVCVFCAFVIGCAMWSPT